MSNVAFALAPTLWRGRPQSPPSVELRRASTSYPARVARYTQIRATTQSPKPDPMTEELSKPKSSSGNGATASPLKSEEHGASNSVHLADVEEERNVKRDVLTTLSWIGVAACVGYTIGARDAAHGLEFATAYIVEYALSVDNLFVFLLIFDYFRVPRQQQSRVLTFGIAGAMLMRGTMIVAGEALTHRFKAVTVGFAGLLLFSAARLLVEDDSDDNDLSHNAVVKFSGSLLNFSDHYDGNRFFTQQNGARLATPLLLVLICIELSDVVFALDSVPAVLGISEDTAVIYASNILAIMGLRSLFFVLSDAIGDLRFLRQSLSIVLGFVGAKMLAGVAGYEVGVLQSLSVVVGTLASGIGLSLAFPENKLQSEETS